MKTLALAAVASSILLASGVPVPAPIFYFEVPLDGAQEVLPNVGDPDGSGLARLWIDDTDAANPAITWDITASDIDFPLTGAHIHQGAFGVNGPVRVDFTSSLTGGPLIDLDLTAVLANPSEWYVNLHNAAHRGGAIRGQIPATPTAVIPESSTWVAMAGITALVLGHQLRRRSVRKDG